MTDILKRPKAAEIGSLTKESDKATKPGDKSGSQSADKDVEMEGPK